MRKRHDLMVRTVIVALTLVALVVGVPACGGGGGGAGDGGNGGGPAPTPQGLQVQNSGLSIWCTTRLYWINLGTLASNNQAYPICPAETGSVVSLAQGTYEWWFEYDAGGPRFFTTSLISVVNANQVTFETVIIS